MVVILIARSRGRRQPQVEAQAVPEPAFDRESQLSSTVEQLRFSGNPVEVSSVVGNLFASQLSMPILAIYSGRDTDERLDNLLLGTQQSPSGTGSLALLPPSVPSIILSEFRAPQITWLSSFLGSRTGELVAPGGPAPDSRRVAVIPWYGQFGWRGLIVARPSEPGLEVASRRGDLIAQIGNRLSVALEFDAGQSQLRRADRRLARLAGFAAETIKNLAQPESLETVVREVASLLSADSAAIWRLDASAKMLSPGARSVSRSTEFLPIPLGQGFAGRIAESATPIAAADAPADPRCLFPN